MTKLERKLRSALRQLGVKGDSPAVVAVSGGADSTALLDALVRWREQKSLTGTITAAHLNHQLRDQESDEDEAFVRQLAARFGLPISVQRIDVAEAARQERVNLEAIARRLRYRFVQHVAESSGADIVLTAHTRDDQVETILMRLLRGSGARGLRGIHPQRLLGDRVRLLRPLLAVTRSDVIEHCENYALTFRNDSSNLSTDLTRNRIRHTLLPLLRTFNPAIDETLIRTSQLIADDHDFLKKIASELFARAHQDSTLDVKLLGSAHAAIRRRVLQSWLRRERGLLKRIDAVHITALENLVLQSQSGRVVELPGGVRVVREFDRLKQFQEQNSDLIEPVNLTHGVEKIFGEFRFTIFRSVPRESANITKSKDIPFYTAVLHESEALDGLRLRIRLPGDRYIPEGGSQQIKLKALMIHQKIPVSERDRYPVLVTGKDEIVWSPGLPVADRFVYQTDRDLTSRCALIVAEWIGNDDG
jgi:tRNA(Ile)-lysidine synthase